MSLVSFLVAVALLVLLVGALLRWFPRSAARRLHSPEEVKAITKQGFSEKKIKEMGKVDCVVIGSGVGGLTTAALLSRRGLKVVVLEQHDVAGGCTHTFEERGFEFDTGLHYVGGDIANPKASMRVLFDTISDGSLYWDKLDSDIYDTASTRDYLRAGETHSDANNSPAVTHVRWHNDPAHSKKELNALFPTEKDAIDAYFKKCKRAEAIGGLAFVLKVLPLPVAALVRSLCDGLLKEVYQPTAAVLASLTKNTDLQGVFTYVFGDYGTTPAHSPFALHSIVNNHWFKGGHYPRGGSGAIAAAIIPTIEATGGRVFVRAPVERILLDEQRQAVRGVVVRGCEILAPMVISGAGLMNTYGRLIHAEDLNASPAARVMEALPAHLRHGGKASNNPLAPSLTMLSLFVGLDKPPSQLDLPKHNVWLFPSWQHDANVATFQQQIKAQATHETVDVSKFQLPALFISFPSSKDSTWETRHPNSSVALVIAPFDYALVEHAQGSKPDHRGQRYEQLKASLQELLLDALKREFPAVKGHIQYVDLGTPLSNDFYLGSSRGEVYGLDHSVARFSSEYDWLLRPAQPLKGLYLTGQDVASCGIGGALIGGVLCAVAVNPTTALDVGAQFIRSFAS